MEFVRRHLGRIVMLFLLVLASGVYVIYYRETGSVMIEGKNATALLASLCLKLYIAFYLVYLLMLIVKMTQDASYAKTSKDKDFKEHAQIQNGSLAFNIILAVITVVIYLGLKTGGYFVV